MLALDVPMHELRCSVDEADGIGRQRERTRERHSYCARGLFRGPAASLLGGEPDANLLGDDLEMTALALSWAR